VCGKNYFYQKEMSTKRCCSKECSEKLKKNRKEYLSSETIQKLHDAGCKSIIIQGDKRRSQNEIYFCHLCENYFKEVKHNIPQFNGWDADVIIEDIKYAILWNGNWHYIEISRKNSLSQIQNRDKIKINEIEKAGYIPYVIEDRGKYNTLFVEEEFNKFIRLIGR
jgi:hypothetical protein